MIKVPIGASGCNVPCDAAAEIPTGARRSCAGRDLVTHSTAR